MKKIILTVLCIITLSACGKDDVSDTQITGFSQIDTDKGFRFTLTYPDGKEKKVNGSSTFGSFNGQLLDGDYYKSFHGGSDDVRFDFRFSVPEDIQILDVIEGTHQLRGQRLLLQQTGNLGALQTEFSLGTSNPNNEFDGLINMTGSATYHQNIAAIGERIAIAVEIEGNIVNREGQNLKITGLFWKAKDDDIR